MSAEEAMAQVVDKILFRHHGIITSQHHGRDALDWLQERGYKVVKIRAGDKGAIESGMDGR